MRNFQTASFMMGVVGVSHGCEGRVNPFKCAEFRAALSVQFPVRFLVHGSSCYIMEHHHRGLGWVCHVLERCFKVVCMMLGASSGQVQFSALEDMDGA